MGNLGSVFGMSGRILEQEKKPDDVVDVNSRFLDAGIGSAIRRQRLRAGLTQVQLARTISRSGKFLSELETGKARISQADLEKLADAIGVRCQALLEQSGSDVDPTESDAPRRIRDVQPSGMTILSFTQLVNHLDRAGWLRGARMWVISDEPFPEENDLALLEQMGSLLGTRQVSLRYVFGADRLTQEERRQVDRNQGTLDVLPLPLVRALRWSATMRALIESDAQRIIGYAVPTPLPLLCRCHTLLWIETEDVSWSEVMPLLYCRSITRTFEKPNESKAFWHHLSRENGSKLLLEIANQLSAVQPSPYMAG